MGNKIVQRAHVCARINIHVIWANQRYTHVLLMNFDLTNHRPGIFFDVTFRTFLLVNSNDDFTDLLR